MIPYLISNGKKEKVNNMYDTCKWMMFDVSKKSNEVSNSISSLFTPETKRVRRAREKKSLFQNNRCFLTQIEIRAHNLLKVSKIEPNNAFRKWLMAVIKKTLLACCCCALYA